MKVGGALAHVALCFFTSFRPFLLRYRVGWRTMRRRLETPQAVRNMMIEQSLNETESLVYPNSYPITARRARAERCRATPVAPENASVIAQFTGAVPFYSRS